MTDYKELIKRLRKQGCQICPICHEASDAIEELQKKYDGAVSDNKSLCRQIAELAKERNEAYGKGLLEGVIALAQRAEDEKWMPKWIPVTERLPEDGTRCLATRFDHVTKTPFLELLWFEGGEWWNRRFRGDFAVTHWMPLPQPPKEETCEAQ